MATEYYFSKNLNIKYLKKHTKGLTFKIFKESGVAIIKDKCDNYLQAWGIRNEHDSIQFFNAKELSGGLFIAHDIALQTNTMFITDESYLELADTLEELEIKDFIWGDSYSMPYIVNDLNMHYLQFENLKRGKLTIVENTHFNCDSDREIYKTYRDAKLKEEADRDADALNKQIAKMNKTNLTKASIVAELDVELTECKTPKASYV